MIVILFAICGVVLGVRGARKRGGKRADQWQWGAGYGIAFTILGLVLTLIVGSVA